MARENLEIARAMVATFNSRDLAGLQALLHEESEFRSKLASIEDVLYVGKDGVAEYMSDIDAVFSAWRLDDVDYRAAGGDGVLLTYRVVGIGKGSGAPVDTPLAMYWRMRDGYGWRGEVFLDRDLALKAAGLALTSRLATPDDIPALIPLMELAIGELQRGYLDDPQIESSRAIMGLDNQLIDDGTYFVVECDGNLAGCGGWSRRATLYGGDHSPGRDAALLDPSADPARVRAMYTHPAYKRRGVGRLILSLCEEAAAAEGFSRLELMATLSGEALYSIAGFEAIETLEDSSGGEPVPLIRMGKAISG